jgi:hypothetical protein
MVFPHEFDLMINLSFAARVDNASHELKKGEAEFLAKLGFCVQAIPTEDMCLMKLLDTAGKWSFLFIGGIGCDRLKNEQVWRCSNPGSRDLSGKSES